MGTRSTVKFYDEQNELILSVYHQFDGYLDGVGHELAEFLNSKKLITGIGDQDISGGFANGMGCLAAQYVKEKKGRIGGLYIGRAGDAQEYNYRVRFVDGKAMIEVDDFFTGTPDELLSFKETS